MTDAEQISGSEGRRTRPFTRRELMLGIVPVAAVAAGAAGSLAVQISRRDQGPGVASVSPQAVPQAATSTPDAAVVSPVSTPASPPVSTPVAEAARPLPNRGLPAGMALVASPRLPLSAVGVDAPWRLVSGQIPNWTAVGSPTPYPVRPLALAGATGTGIDAAETFQDYASLAAAMAADAAAVALIPAELVDFRVQSLSVGEVNPVLEPAYGSAALRIGVIGDIVPGRNVHLHMERYGDFTRPFRRIAPLLSAFDVTVANLEGNLSDSLPQPADPHSVTFVSNPAMLEGFGLAGIDAVTLANNHSTWNDEGWGVQGLLDTIAALDAAGIAYFGAGQTIDVARSPWVIEAGGIRIAFLGIDGVTANYEIEPGMDTGVLDVDVGAAADRAGTNPYLAAQVMADVSAAATVADIVIPYFHLGAEYVAVPPPWAVQAAHTAIDAGAAMVVTNHPHLIQGMEIYAGRPIIYSLGNFILDQMWAAEVRSGYALEVVLHGTKIAALRFHGVEIEEFHRPRRMAAGEQAALMDRFWAASDRLAAREGAGGQS